MIVWAFAEIEADFQRFYNLNLYDELFNRKITWRRFNNLVRALPPESAFGDFIRDRTKRSLVEVL